jgi:hypothetical protein
LPHPGYAIENVWITMVMITNKTPNLMDSFVWIVPVVLAIIIRPYIIRYAHHHHLTLFREIAVTSLSLIVGAVGCLIVASSCDLRGKGIVLLP